MENKSWDFGGQAQVEINNEQLSWSTVSGQNNAYPVQSITGAHYEVGGFLRLVSPLNDQLILIPKTTDSEQLASEIDAYLGAFHAQAKTTTAPPITEASTPDLVPDELAKLEHLKAIGFLTEEEFQQMKHKLQL